MSILLFDVGIPGETAALIAGVGFLFILLAATYVLFRLLRKSVKMAFRAAMLCTVLFMLAVGAFAVYWFASGSTSRPEPRPAPRRQR